MKTLQELAEASACYGRLYSPADHACKRCEVWLRCSAKTKEYIAGMPSEPPDWALAANTEKAQALGKLPAEQLESMLRSFGRDPADFACWEEPANRRMHMAAVLAKLTGQKAKAG